MKRVLAFTIVTSSVLFSIFLISTPVQGQDLENTLLWKIEKKGHEASYLYGTIHMLPQEDFELKPKVEKAFTESDLLVMELDLSDPNLQMEMMKYAQMTDGSTLDQFLSPTEFAQLDTMLRETVGMGLNSIRTMKPFMVSTFLLSRYVGSQPASFEMNFMMKAKSDSKPIQGLETLSEQMAVFDSISYEVQAEGLVEMIEEEEEMQQLYRDLVVEYKAENLTGLGELLESEMDGEGEAEFLLDRRNENWVGRINGITSENKAFIAVGAGHLSGEKGVIQLLREDGYKVIPVMK
jgi:uncharacterized protein YbaP (TraB family)